VVVHHETKEPTIQYDTDINIDCVHYRLTGFRDDANEQKNKQKSGDDTEKSGERREDFHGQLSLAVVRH